MKKLLFLFIMAANVSTMQTGAYKWTIINNIGFPFHWTVYSTQEQTNQECSGDLANGDKVDCHGDLADCLGALRIEGTDISKKECFKWDGNHPYSFTRFDVSWSPDEQDKCGSNTVRVYLSKFGRPAFGDLFNRE